MNYRAFRWIRRGHWTVIMISAVILGVALYSGSYLLAVANVAIILFNLLLLRQLRRMVRHYYRY